MSQEQQHLKMGIKILCAKGGQEKLLKLQNVAEMLGTFMLVLVGCGAALDWKTQFEQVKNY